MIQRYYKNVETIRVIASLASPSIYIFAATSVYALLYGSWAPIEHMQKHFYTYVYLFLPKWPIATLLLYFMSRQEENKYKKALSSGAVWFIIESYYIIMPTETHGSRVNIVSILDLSLISTMYFMFSYFVFTCIIQVFRR